MPRRHTKEVPFFVSFFGVVPFWGYWPQKLIILHKKISAELTWRCQSERSMYAFHGIFYTTHFSMAFIRWQHVISRRCRRRYQGNLVDTAVFVHNEMNAKRIPDAVQVLKRKLEGLNECYLMWGTGWWRKLSAEAIWNSRRVRRSQFSSKCSLSSDPRATTEYQIRGLKFFFRQF